MQQYCLVCSEILLKQGKQNATSIRVREAKWHTGRLMQRHHPQQISRCNWFNTTQQNYKV